jgi:hypothetical protein
VANPVTDFGRFYHCHARHSKAIIFLTLQRLLPNKNKSEGRIVMPCYFPALPSFGYQHVVDLQTCGPWLSVGACIERCDCNAQADQSDLFGEGSHGVSTHCTFEGLIARTRFNDCSPKRPN